LIPTSLASERLVIIVKTYLPKLPREDGLKAQEVDLIVDRCTGALAIAVSSAWVMVGLSSPANAEVT
jgi:hypothetical protein